MTFSRESTFVFPVVVLVRVEAYMALFHNQYQRSLPLGVTSFSRADHTIALLSFFFTLCFLFADASLFLVVRPFVLSSAFFACCDTP